MATALDIDKEIAKERARDTSLSKFFESNLKELHRIKLKDVHLRILHEVALTIQSTRPDDELYWMAFLNDLGIVENRAIIYIKLTSKFQAQSPIYLALAGPLFERLTFGDLVEVLMKYERGDVLRHIKPFAESCLDTSLGYSYIAERPTAPEAEELEKEKSEDSSSKILNVKYEKSHLNMHGKENGQTVVDDSGNRTDTITILILHADSDNGVAQNLIEVLREAGLIAKTLSHFDHLLMMNSFEVFPALISAVDFIVPIVSEAFLRSIHSRNSRLMNAFDNVEPSEIDESDYEVHFSHNSNNHYIYQLILDQYVRNKCLNFNVRPVMVPHFNWNLLTYEVLLKQSFRLWENVPDFIVMLNKTKQLLNRMAARRMNRF